ncbi:MAG: hypothetical protein HYY04_17785 [Chloroflexi bacterium]|nr:hypothetical protein [Chloroflexota bacterium]
MDKPRTLAELRQHWLSRMVRGWETRAQPDQGARSILHQLVEYLTEAMRDPERDREDALQAAALLEMSDAAVRDEDVPSLIELARTAREVRGPGSQGIEQAALRLLVEVADENVLPFLAESFRFTRQHDSSAGRRRPIVLRGIAAIAILREQPDALALLREALTHRTWRMRKAACRAIVQVMEMQPGKLPSPLEETLRSVAATDPVPEVRVVADRGLGRATVYW